MVESMNGRRSSRALTGGAHPFFTFFVSENGDIRGMIRLRAPPPPIHAGHTVTSSGLHHLLMSRSATESPNLSHKVILRSPIVAQTLTSCDLFTFNRPYI